VATNSANKAKQGRQYMNLISLFNMMSMVFMYFGEIPKNSQFGFTPQLFVNLECSPN
jgi:hypothetical protein